jgi:hypothetical protein
MIELINIAEAKSQIHMTSTDLDEDIALKCLEASSIIYEELNIQDESPQTYPWDDAVPAGEVPYNLKAAARLVFAELFVNRDASSADVLSPTVMRLIAKWKTPALG